MNPSQRPPNQGTPGQQPGHPGQGPRPQIGQQAGQPQMNGMPPMISYSVRGQSGFQGGMNPHMNPPTSIQGGNFPPNQMGHHGNYPRPQMAYQQIRPPIFQTTATTGIPTQQRFITSQQGLRPPHYQSGNQPQIRQQSPYGQGGFPAGGGQQFHPYNPRMPYNNRFPVNTQFGFNQQPYANQIPQQMNFSHQRPQQPNQQNVGGPGQIPGPAHITNVNGQPPNQINPNAPVFHPTADEFAPRPHVNQSPTFNPAFQSQQSQNVPKKKSRAILITDPETGKPIDMDEDTPRSRQQSESQKSDKGNSEVAVEKESTTTPPVTEEVVKEVPVKEVVKEEPEQPVVQEQPAQEQDDGGWEAVPTKPKKGGKKTNQKNETNKGQVQQKGKDVKSKKVEVENKEVQEVVEKVKELKVEETKVESPVEKVPVEEPKKETKVEAAVETPVVVKTPEPTVEEVKKPEVETVKVEPEVKPAKVEPEVEKVEAEKVEPAEPASPTEDKTEEKVEEKVEDATEGEEGEKTATPDPTEEAESAEDHQSLALSNREKIEKGEKVAYDRDFLLKFQSACLDKPAELPDLEVILVAPTDAHRRAPAHERPQTNFQPHYIQGGRGGRGGRQGSRQGDRRGSRNPNTMTIKLPSTQKKLNELPAEMKFKPGIKEDLSSDEKAKQQFQREAKNILNKLTPENEARLTAKFVSLQPKSLELLNVIVSTLFEKAICEPHFAKQYAKLCKACHEKWEKKYKFEVVDPRKPNEKKKKAFREVLLTRAQEKFEKLKILHVRDKELFEEKSIERKRIEIEEKLAALPKEGEEGYDKKQDMELSEELNDLNARIKVQSMGNVTFVGELYLEKLLSVNIMIGCMRQLINSEHETELESLSKLIPTIGRELENEQRGQENLSRVFQQIDQVIENGKTLGNNPKTVSPRVICLLQDIVDLKKRNWQLRATQQGKGPAKLNQLHNEHHRAEAEKQAELTNKIAHDNRRRTQENRAKSERFNTGQWTTTHGQPITKPRFDPTSLASSKNRSNDTGDQPQRLGPARGPRGITKGRSNDSRSTDTAPNSRSQTPDIAPNKFALLDDDGDMDTLKSMPRSQSFNRDRRASEAPNRNNDRHRMTKHMTHDGRTHERKKLTLEELEKKTRTVLNDWQEANGEVKLLEEVCEDILKYGLLETPDHQKLMIKQMIDHVLEKNEDSRLAMGKFFHIMADKLSGLHFEEPLKCYIECVIDEDFLTDCPKFWEFFCMIIAPIFRSRNTNAKIVNNIFEKASEAMAMTKGLCTLLQELSFVFGTKNKEALHEFFTASGIDIGESLKKDEMEGETPKERLGRIGRQGLAWLLEPLVRVNWGEVEHGLTEILQKHDFTTDTSANDFNKEFDFLEEKVPLGPDGRGNLFFTQVVVTAVMNYSVIRESDNWKLKASGDDVALADCGLLLQKYLDDSNRQIDALFILADLFNRYDNNQVVVNETFRALYEISVIEISTFEQWKGLEQATKLKNYPLIITATTKFYEALEEEKREQASA